MKQRNIEQIFGGGGTNLPIEVKRPGTGRRGFKKRLCAAFIVSVAVLSLCACGKSEEDKEKEQQAADYDTAKTIEQQIEETPLPKGFSGLLEQGDFVTVSCSDGEATVTITARSAYSIPYVAEEFLPAVQQAIEDAGVSLKRLDINSHVMTTHGIADDTFASWQTEDGVTGTFTDDTQEESVVETDFTIDDLYEYFTGYEELVQTLIEEAGGGNE